MSGKVAGNPNPTPKVDCVESMFFVPYIGKASILYGRKIRQIFKRYFCIDLKIIYTTFKVRNYFSLKCPTPLILKANVVYKYTCLCDADTTYISKTKRHLAIRMKEHLTISNSAIKQHIEKCPSCQSAESQFDNFSVIDSGRNDFETTIKEALNIKSSNPSLNKQLFASGSLYTLELF